MSENSHISKEVITISEVDGIYARPLGSKGFSPYNRHFGIEIFQTRGELGNLLDSPSLIRLVKGDLSKRLLDLLRLSEAPLNESQRQEDSFVFAQLFAQSERLVSLFSGWGTSGSKVRASGWHQDAGGLRFLHVINRSIASGEPSPQNVEGTLISTLRLLAQAELCFILKYCRSSRNHIAHLPKKKPRLLSQLLFADDGIKEISIVVNEITTNAGGQALKEVIDADISKLITANDAVLTAERASIQQSFIHHQPWPSDTLLAFWDGGSVMHSAEPIDKSRRDLNNNPIRYSISSG